MKMKLTMMGMVAMLALNCLAQVTFIREQRIPDAPETQEAREAREAKDVKEREKYFMPRDPWRVSLYEAAIDDGHVGWFTATNYAKGQAWVQFSGEVTDIFPDNIILKGWCGRPMDFDHGSQNIVIRLLHFPYPVVKGTTLRNSGNFTAMGISNGREQMAGGL